VFLEKKHLWLGLIKINLMGTGGQATDSVDWERVIQQQQPHIHDVEKWQRAPSCCKKLLSQVRDKERLQYCKKTYPLLMAMRLSQR
jgi:hypothetical protein